MVLGPRGMADLVERILARERPFIDSLIVHSVEKNRKFNCAIVVPAHFSNLPIVKMPLCTFVFRISFLHLLAFRARDV